MLSPAMTRAGIVLSGLWLTIGGYYIYQQHSYQEHWDNVRGICLAGSADLCAEMTAQAHEYFSPEWATIITHVLVGSAAIWGALLAIAWIRRGSSPE